jgi:hypothetical protein
MKRYIFVFCIGFLLALPGCGGGGGGESAPQLTTGAPPPPAVPPTPPENPPPVSASAFDCDSPGPVVPGQGIDALPGGYYQGSLFDCQLGYSVEVIALVSNDGRFRVFPFNSSESHLLSGTLRTDERNFQGSGLDFAQQGVEYFSGGATDLWIDGAIRARQSLDGRWGTEWGGYGYFTLSYTVAYEIPSSFERLAGDWGWYGETNPHGGQVTWTIEASGRISGQDTTGCDYAGQLGIIDPRYNVYELTVTIAGCEMGGDYSGLASRTAGPFEDVLHVSVDDGDQRALGLYLLNSM